MSEKIPKKSFNDEVYNSKETDSDTTGSESELDPSNEEIQVEFEGRSLVDSDFHGIRQLFQQLFLKAHLNLSQLTDIVIEQNYIGSVIIQSDVAHISDDDDLDDDNTIFGITTVINITKKRDINCVQDLIILLLSRAENNCNAVDLQKLKDILTSDQHTVGFLINERFINIPAQISFPLFHSLQKELQTAADKKMPYNFSHYIMVVKLYKQDMGKDKPLEIIFSNSEEEVLCKLADISFEYSVQEEVDSGMSDNWREDGEPLLPFRKVILFDANTFSNLPTVIKSFIENS